MYLKKRGARQYTNLFKKYGEMFNIKQEVAICIANSETGIGRNMLATGNIGNINSHSHKAYVLDDGSTADRDAGVKAIYQAGLNGQYLINKRTIGDLYTNGDCEIDC